LRLPSDLWQYIINWNAILYYIPSMYPDLATMGDLDACLHSLDESRAELRSLLGEIDDAMFTHHSGNGEWSPAQIAEHIALAERSAAKVIRFLRNAGDRPLPTRPVEEGKRREDGRAIAPQMVTPTGELTRAEVLAALDDARGSLVDESTRSRAVIDAGPTFPHPFMGQLTALGWLQMMAWHEPHHIQQLRRTMAAV
jgi:hypothetical protein